MDTDMKLSDFAEIKELLKVLEENGLLKEKEDVSSLVGYIERMETKLSENDCLSFIIDEEIDFVAEDKNLDVVYEDDYVLIVNKPANMIIHPDDKNILDARMWLQRKK